MSHSINGHFTPISLLKFAAPSIIMMMFMSLYTIIDGIFISRFVGSNALSSLNIVYPIINIVFAIGTMLGTGGNAIISRYMGEGKNKTAKECMTQFVVIGLIISVIILVLTRLNLSSPEFSEPVISCWRTATAILPWSSVLHLQPCSNVFSSPILLLQDVRISDSF